MSFVVPQHGIFLMFRAQSETSRNERGGHFDVAINMDNFLACTPLTKALLFCFEAWQPSKAVDVQPGLAIVLSHRPASCDLENEALRQHTGLRWASVSGAYVRPPAPPAP